MLPRRSFKIRCLEIISEAIFEPKYLFQSYLYLLQLVNSLEAIEPSCLKCQTGALFQALDTEMGFSWATGNAGMGMGMEMGMGKEKGRMPKTEVKILD